MTTLVCEWVSVALHGRRVVSNVGFEVCPGEWLTLIGPNGAGKTTLLRAIAGLTRFDGSISLVSPSGERRLVDRSFSVRARARAIAYVPQQPFVPFGVTVLQYVLLGRSAHIPVLGFERAEDVTVARRVIHALGLDALAERQVEELSGGEWQRAVLARALAQEADVLLLDEPTTSLDIGHQQDVLELVDELRRERGLVVVSTMHELTLAGQYADRLLLLSDGAKVIEGSAVEVLTRALLSEHYGADVEVQHHEHGVTLIPVRGSRPRP